MKTGMLMLLFIKALVSGSTNFEHGFVVFLALIKSSARLGVVLGYQACMNCLCSRKFCRIGRV